jgi:hypothetical protein
VELFEEVRREYEFADSQHCRSGAQVWRAPTVGARGIGERGTPAVARAKTAAAND